MYLSSKSGSFLFLNKILIWFFASLYFLLTLNIKHYYYRDRVEYESYASNSDFIFSLYDGIGVYFNEPLFLSINIFLNKWFDPATTVYFLSNTILIVILYLLGKYSKNFLTFILGLCILFFSYYLFHFQFVILRQALATIFFIFFFRDGKKTNILFCLTASFIHSSFFLISFLYILFIFFEKKIDYRKLSYLFFVFSLFLSFFILKMASFLGVRQANQDHVLSSVTVGGGAFLVFSFLFLYMLFLYKGIKDELFKMSLIFLACFLGFYFFNPIAGRLMSSFLFIILLVLVRDSGFKNILLLIYLLIVFIVMAFMGTIEGMSLLMPYNSYLDQFFSMSFL